MKLSTKSELSFWNLLILFCLIFTLLSSIPSFPQVKSFEEIANEGKSNLEIKEFEKAYQIFQETADSVTDNKWRSYFTFFMGLTRQKQAEEATDTIKKQEYYELAVSQYQKVLELQPNSGSAKNNLAQIYSQIGEKKQVEKLYREAIKLGDSREPFYAMNFADFLSAKGNKEEAIKYYERALNKQPENSIVHEKLIDIYCLTDSSKLFPYLWKIQNDGFTVRAQNGALKALKKVKWSREDKAELLTIIAVSLSRQYYNPETFLKSDVYSTLEKFATDRSIGEGVVQLFKLHRISNPKNSEFDWWRGKMRPDYESYGGASPEEGFMMLIRSIGDWYRYNSKYNESENFYLFSAKFSYELDPESILKLADLYLETGSIESLEGLVKDYVPHLFDIKMIAYKINDAKKIYNLHRALGVIYANVKQWGNDFTPTSAIFQLKHAINTARTINRNATNEKNKVIIDPRLVNLLADGYNHTGNMLEAFSVRLEAADEYISINKKIYAKQVLEPLKINGVPEGIPEHSLKRYSTILQMIEGNN